MPTQTKGVGGNGFLTGIKAVSAGRHSMALATDGTVFAWGDNGEGQLGKGTTIEAWTPVKVQLPNAGGPLPNIKAISAGKHSELSTVHSLALDAHGNVWSWGNNTKGELGDGTFVQRNNPVQVTSLTNVVEVSGGLACSLAVHWTGRVFAWGDNSYGQLGNGSTTGQNKPQLVLNVNSSGAADVLTGIASVSVARHSLAVGVNGKLYAWGRNTEGQLGIDNAPAQYTPAEVSLMATTVAASAGYRHSLALRADGLVFAWGDNSDGQLGDGTTVSRHTPMPVKAPVGDPSGAKYLTRIVAIAAGYYSSCALRADGKLFTWGNGLSLGNGSNSGSATPVQVSNLSGVMSVHAGTTHYVVTV
ncbi:RCC1 domain-containing protein [Saccharothrix variisporea]|uniref:Alpha-tubulin suppressor-like RCC1 family protein n=1 Tax=Saccharothrix variisporea TaxID=543527 RepID=A0A495X7G7_9PSEU|nr:RCC1 domain-containing protein [Saccharothrix variisporea]RKT69396.1 alpha-tubulin suppressor-like RCC1 family protein [Saccharothrix variisporea]